MADTPQGARRPDDPDANSPDENASEFPRLRGGRLYGYGVALLLAMVLLAVTDESFGTLRFLGLMGIASVAYLAAMYEITRARACPRLPFLICLVVALMLRIPLLFTPAGEHDDVYRYIWDGHVQRFGHNPYVAVPSDPSLSHLHTPATSRMNNPAIPSPYPPGAQIYFRAVTMIDESVLAFRLALLLCDGLIVFLLLRWLAESGANKWLVLTYAWHPLVVLEGARNGHVDFLGISFLIGSFLAITRGRTTIATISLALAVAVKFLPIVLVPLLWRRVPFRALVLAVALYLALYVPFLSEGHLPTGGIGNFVERFRFNSPMFSFLEQFASPRALAALAILAGLLTASWFRIRLPVHSPEAWAYPIAVALVFAPVIYPWYLLWLIPFLRVPANVPLMIWSVSILSTYVVWDLVRSGMPWAVPWWVSLFEFGMVAAAAVWLVLRKSIRTENEF